MTSSKLTPTTVSLIILHRGTQREREEVVRPLTVRGDKTLVAFIKGASIATRWVKTERITTRELAQA